MVRLRTTLVILASLISSQAFGALVLTQGDGPTPKVYANGGGGGFGGTLGNGAITMDVNGGNLDIGLIQGNALNDIVALFLDTEPGGQIDATMNDTADGSRRALSNLTANDNDLYPTYGTTPVQPLLPDYGVAFGNFGTVLFKLNAGNTPGHLTFLQFTGTVGAISIPLATLSSPIKVDFFAGYVADSGFNSNESLPFSVPLNSAGNPGFGDGSVHVYENFNRFVTHAIPEASTFLVWGLILATAGLFKNRVRSSQSAD